MVKADVTRNYYAELGVSPNADESEIRKAFRQLALKWHPDRNPGREAEFVAKFQQIQAAHEVLTDPVQRAKYDTERKKYRNLNIPPYNPSTPRTRPPPPSRSAYTTTPSGSYYRAPPPQPSPQRPPPPQQHHTSYANGADRFTSKNFRAPPTAQRPDARPKDADARANVFTAWQKMKQPRGEPRPYNPSNPNGTPFGRSKSTRMPSSKTGFDPATPGGDEGQARSSYRSHYERPDPSPPAPEDPLKNFKPGTTADEVPFAEGNRVRTPYYSTVPGERTSMFADGFARSASVRNSPTHTHRPGSSADPGSYSDSGRRPQRNSYSGHSPKPRFPNMYASSSDDESESEVFRSGTKHRGPPPAAESPQQQPAWTPGVFGNPRKPPPAGTSPNPPNPFKSRSEESINMKFSPSDWHGKFEGKPDYFAPNIQKGASGKGRTSPTRGRPSQRGTTERNPFSGRSVPPPPVSTFSQSQTSQMPPPPPPPPPPPGPPPSFNAQTGHENGAPAAPYATKFAPEAWAETFKEPSWAYPLKAKDTSPRRGSTASKRPNPSRKPSVAPEASAVASKESTQLKTKPKYQAFAEDAASSGGDAMDIDSNTPPEEKAMPSESDSRPKDGRPQPQKNAGPGTVTNGTAAPATFTATSQPPAPGLNGLSGLTNVEPFLPTTNSGLGGLDELKSSLPFKSQASDAHPTKPNSAQKLKFPTVPKAPDPPSKLDKTSTDAYFKQWERYARDFQEYRKVLTTHFVARLTEFDNLAPGFIHNRGETTKKLGFSSYLHKNEEDGEILQTWNVAHEKHIRALEQCAEVRNKTIKLFSPS